MARSLPIDNWEYPRINNGAVGKSRTYNSIYTPRELSLNGKIEMAEYKPNPHYLTANKEFQARTSFLTRLINAIDR